VATEEIVQTIDRLQGALADLAVRGLRSAGPQELATLRSTREEFERIGAGHLAGQIAEVITAIESDNRGAARALLHAQASLRVFERILTLEVVGHVLQAMLGEGENEAEEEAP
jgi:hypothetical protein